MSYRYKDWSLYKENVKLNTGQEVTLYFFSKWKPKKGTPCDLPNGYQILVNGRIGLPYLSKIESYKKI